MHAGLPTRSTYSTTECPIKTSIYCLICPTKCPHSVLLKVIIQPALISQNYSTNDTDIADTSIIKLDQDPQCPRPFIFPERDAPADEVGASAEYCAKPGPHAELIVPIAALTSVELRAGLEEADEV